MKFTSYLSSAAGICLLLSTPTSVLAQSALMPQPVPPPQPPPQQQQQQAMPIVKAIDVQYAGPSTVSKSRILANMRTQVGKPYSQQAVEEDIRNLYSSGNVTNVRIFGEPVKDGVKVMVVVQTKTTVSEVVIEGVTQVKEKALHKLLTVKPGQPLNEANLELDRQKILETYEKKNYSDTKVEYKIETNEAKGKTRIVFVVREGAKVVIGGIVFEGNTVFKSKQLRKVMKTKPSNILSYFTKDGQLKNDQLDEDTAAIREFYQNHGYIDAEVKPYRTEPEKGDKVTLVIPIVEGTQYHVGTVTVIGAQVFTTDEVAKVVKTSPNAVFSPKGMRDDVKAIQDMYGARGYIDLGVNAETTSGGKNTINVALKLDEGNQFYVEQINILGNTRTKDKVIRRELALTPGDVYNSVRVDASKQRLTNLNYFSKVETYPSDTPVPGRKDLNVLVEEKRTGSFNFGAGFSSIDSILGFVEVQQSNFDLMHPWNFTGGGQRFRTRIQYGAKRKDFIIGLTDPWFMDYQIAVGGELFYNQASYLSTVYNQSDYGFDLNVRKALTPFMAARLEYRLENIRIYDVAGDASSTIKGEAGNYLKSNITAGITHDTRDSVFISRKGHKVDFSIYMDGGPIGGDVNDYGFDLSGSQYFLLPWDTIFLINGEIASVSGFAGGNKGTLNPPIFDRLYLGGANNLRGFSYREVGPKDHNGQPIGGNTLARLTIEYTVPVVDRVRAAIFFDTGFVNFDSYNFGPEKYTPPPAKSTSPTPKSTGGLNSDVGIGLRLDLPIGPVRVDFGIPVQSDSWNKSSGKFNFNIGSQF
ncbi:MAG: outer membrane protein assembly factor BamA [Verrucomicrobiota bacterium]